MPHPWLTSIRDDIYGGLVSAAVAIPLAMGFGMFAFSSLGENYFADGALAGLITAFALGVVCILLGDKSTTVFAPRINSTFFLGLLLYGLLHTDVEIIKDGGVPLALAVLFSVILLGGVFQTLFGLIGVGTLIRFAPYPVMAGFQRCCCDPAVSGSSGEYLRLRPQHAVHAGAASSLPRPSRSISPSRSSTFLIMWNVKKFIPKVPPLVLALAARNHSLLRLAASRASTPISDRSSPNRNARRWVLHHFPISRILRAATTSLRAVRLPSSAARWRSPSSPPSMRCFAPSWSTPPGGKRVDGNMLLTRLGLGNVAAACIGGITVGHQYPGPTVTNRTLSAHVRRIVLVNSAAVLVAATVLFPLAGQMPRVVLSAVIMVIAIQHIDPWSIQLVKRCIAGTNAYPPHHTRSNSLSSSPWPCCPSALNIVSAVFIGVAIAVALFVINMSRSTVRRSNRCDAIHSRPSRSAERMKLLVTRGATILVFELQGALFFGTGETLLREIDRALAQETRCVILDTRRVSEIDSTGAQILQEIHADLTRRKITLLITASEGTRAIERLREYGILDDIAGPGADLSPTSTAPSSAPKTISSPQELANASPAADPWARNRSPKRSACLRGSDHAESTGNPAVPDARGLRDRPRNLLSGRTRPRTHDDR